MIGEGREGSNNKNDSSFDDSKSKDRMDVSSGSTPSTANLDYWGGNTPWITPKVITKRNTHRYKSNSEQFLTNEGTKKAGRVYPINTVMLTKRAPVGFAVINKIPMTTNQGFMNFICGKKLIPEFLLYWLKANTPYLERIANGSTFDELYPYDLYELKIGEGILSHKDALTEYNTIASYCHLYFDSAKHAIKLVQNSA